MELTKWGYNQRSALQSAHRNPEFEGNEFKFLFNLSSVIEQTYVKHKFVKRGQCIYINSIEQANITDELEERIEALEQNVEELENEDALLNVRLFDVEMDVFENENAIEGYNLNFNLTEYFYSIITCQSILL